MCEEEHPGWVSSLVDCPQIRSFHFRGTDGEVRSTTRERMSVVQCEAIPETLGTRTTGRERGASKHGCEYHGSTADGPTEYSI